MESLLSNKRKFFAACFAVMACAFLLCGCSGNFGKKTINLDNYVDVTFSGYNGYGVATVTLDVDAINEDYGDKITVNADSWYYTDDSTVGEVINDWVGLSASNNSNLSNGDTVTLNWDVSSSYIEQYIDCELKYNEKEYVVEGLEDIETVDVFEGISVTYSGYSPVGSVKISGNDYSSHGTFACADTYLANGDEITVTYEYNTFGGEKSFISEFGAIPESFEKTYVVSGLDSYVDSFADLSDENIGILETEALDQVEAKFQKDAIVTLGFELFSSYTAYGRRGSDYTLENVYYLKAKEPSYASTYGGYYSGVVFVYSVSFECGIKSGNYPYQGRAYYAVAFKNLVLEESGNIVGTSSNTTTLYSSLDEAYTSWVTSNKDKFIIDIYDADLNLQ